MSDGSIGRRVTNLYYDAFESKAKSVLAAACKYEDDERIVAYVVDSKELRGPLDNLENFASINKSFVDPTVGSLVGWRVKLKDETTNKERADLGADAILVRACLQILLHNETWQNHWQDKREIGLTCVTDNVVRDLSLLVTNRVKYWSLESQHPLTEGRRRVSEMLIELLGQLSRFRFGPVTKHATDEISRHLSKSEVIQGKAAEREVLLYLRLLRCSRPPVYTTDAQNSTRLDFLLFLLSITKKTHKNKGLKRGLCEILAHTVTPLALSTNIHSSQSSQTYEDLYEMAERWSKKPKHMPAAVPLQTALICIQPDVTKDRIQAYLDLVMKRLSEDKPDKERTTRCMHLECLLHVLGYFLTRCSGEALPSVAPRYIPPPPEDSRSGHSGSKKEKERGEERRREATPTPSFSSDVTSKVYRAICNMGRKQLIVQAGFRSYALCIDLVTLMCRTITTEGISAIAALIPSFADMKEVCSENTLVGLYSLLSLTQLAQHYQPQGAVEEPGGICQGIPLPWWALGVPHSRGSSSHPVRLKSPFTSYRPQAPVAATLWPADKCTTPALSGLWAVGMHLLLDTSTLCSHSIVPPQVFYSKLLQHSEELTQRVSVCLNVCEKELCPTTRIGKRLGWTETSEKERPSIHIFRIALLASVSITPSEYTSNEYFAMLARLVVHPQVELRETVCMTVLPQIVVQRPSCTSAILNALADLLLLNICDSVALQVFSTLIRLLGLLELLNEPTKHSLLPAAIFHMIGKPSSVIGSFADQGTENSDKTWIKLEAGCLVFLTSPNVEIKGKALAVLHRVAKIAPGDTKRVATVLEKETEEIEATVVSMLTEARASGADWSESKEHKRVNGLLSLQRGEGIGDFMPHMNHELPEYLKNDDLPNTALTFMVLYSHMWPYCLGVISEVLSSQCPSVPSIACRALSQRFPLHLQKLADQKGELTPEDRRCVELCQGYAVVCIAGCEQQHEVLAHVVSMLRSAIQDLADVAAVGLTFLPRSAVPYVIEQLRCIDEEVRVLARKDKNKRQVWLLRGHIIKAYCKALQKTYSNDWVDILSINKLSDWVDEQLELLLSIQADRLLYFDQLTVLRCRADILEVINTTASLFHQHVNNRCLHLVEAGRRRKWLAFSMNHAQTNTYSSRGRSREDSPVINTEIEMLLDTARKRGKQAVHSLLCGPILIQPDMEWVEDIAAGRHSHKAGTTNGRDVTFAGLLSFIHSLLPHHEGDMHDTNSYRVALNMAKGCMVALLKCNMTCPGLLRASAALVLHKDASIAKLHMWTLAHAVTHGSMPPTPTIPWVLAAVVCGLPSHDQLLQESSWKLLPFVCPMLKAKEYDQATAVIQAAAGLLPEAGAVLVSLAKERLPLFTTPRRVALLSALVHWAQFLKLDAPSDVDELLVLTELYSPSHPDVLQELWNKLNTFESIIQRVQEKCIASLGSEPPQPSKATQLCDTVISLMPMSAVKCVINKIEDLLQPDAQYLHRAVTALMLAATVANVVDPINLAPFVPLLLHALATVGCNNSNAHIAQRCRLLLVNLLPSDNTDTLIDKSRDRIRDLLSLWEGQPFMIEGNVLSLVLASKPLHTEVKQPWMQYALKCLYSEMPNTVKIQSLAVYSSLTGGVQDLSHAQVLLQSFVISIISKNFELAVKLCGILQPVLVEFAKRRIGIPAIWGVITLVKCKDTPIAEAAVSVATACLVHLPKPDNASERVYTLLRAVLSQLYIAPNHNGLVMLLVTLTSMMPEWLSSSTVSSYQCIAVASLLPEICTRMSVHTAPDGILSQLATSCKGSLGQVLRPRSSTDILHRVTEAVAERMWGGSEIRDSEIGNFYHHLVKSEQQLIEVWHYVVIHTTHCRGHCRGCCGL
eukprot:TRINITY_DN14809_c1_g1_i2.p1 TRINITY_DN14809_c1_g1~~TRINITY_DN14809_c1_g1_i2.p1  ORF type:complete len:1875 (+),score=546.89 TRINITY_DN14809_c1_g1_i2:49-5625(+)